MTIKISRCGVARVGIFEDVERCGTVDAWLLRVASGDLEFIPADVTVRFDGESAAFVSRDSLAPNWADVVERVGRLDESRRSFAGDGVDVQVDATAMSVVVDLGVAA